MKNGLMLIMVGAALVITGCDDGGSAGIDESKPLTQVAAEATQMGQEELQKMVAKYEGLIAEKMAELDALTAKAKAIPLTEMMGEKATQLKADASEIQSSITALKAQLDKYLAALQAE
jgi:Skp family chaperone for outer membrane proteins